MPTDTRETFDYRLAFSRTIGWITPAEQDILRAKRVAIAGLGGVGGSHLLTLTRLGIGGFSLAEMDTFELQNFNRQAGAFMSTTGRPKLDVLDGMARDINPELENRVFPSGVTDGNLADFLDGVDLYVDSLDFFNLDTRRQVFATCADRGIPAITAAPLGMGTAVLAFLPGRMSFEEYFRLEGQPSDEQYLRFLLGLSPARLQMSYLVEPSAVNLAAHRGPSTPMACELCAGVASTEALKILLGRGGIVAAPHGYHFDAYLNRLARTWRPFGNGNVVQRAALALGRKRFREARLPERGTPPPADAATPTTLRILDLARWAPSGDNTQPWRFEIVDDEHIVVHGNDTRTDTVYDLQGHASQLSLGMLLETLSVAATQFGRRAEITRRNDLPDSTPTFDVHIPVAEPPSAADALAPYIRARTVQRRAMRTRALTAYERQALEASMATPYYKVVWLESAATRLRVARMLSENSKLRLTIPEAYQVHRRIIRWNMRFSEDGIPDAALGVDPMTVKLMGTLMKSWERVRFANRFLGGTLMPRLQLDLIPGMACAAHCLIVAESPARTVDDFVGAGRAIQRFWLTAARLGLHHQPEITPLVFSEYVRDGIRFSDAKGAMQQAESVSRRLERLVGKDTAERAVWMGRLGESPPPRARSTRLPMEELIRKGA